VLAATTHHLAAILAFLDHRPIDHRFEVDRLKHVRNLAILDPQSLVERLALGPKAGDVGSDEDLVGHLLAVARRIVVEERDELGVIESPEVEAGAHHTIDEIEEVRCRLEARPLDVQTTLMLHDESRQRDLPFLEVGEIADGTCRMFWHGGKQIMVGADPAGSRASAASAQPPVRPVESGRGRVSRRTPRAAAKTSQGKAAG
jgi:hypothetical protein